MLFGKYVQIQSFFPLKDKVQHLSSSVIRQKGESQNGETYVGETIRNWKIRWDEHNDVYKNSDPAKNLARNLSTSLVGMYLQEHRKIPSKEEFWRHTL